MTRGYPYHVARRVLTPKYVVDSIEGFKSLKDAKNWLMAMVANEMTDVIDQAKPGDTIASVERFDGRSHIHEIVFYHTGLEWNVFKRK